VRQRKTVEKDRETTQTPRERENRSIKHPFRVRNNERTAKSWSNEGQRNYATPLVRRWGKGVYAVRDWERVASSKMGLREKGELQR